MHPRSCFGAGQHVGDLRNGAILEVEQHDGGSLRPWQLRHGTEYVKVQANLRRAGIVQQFELSSPPFPPARSYGQSDRDPSHPGIWALIARDSPPVLEELKEGLLHDVPSELQIADDQVRRSHEPRKLGSEEVAELGFLMHRRFHDPQECIEIN